MKGILATSLLLGAVLGLVACDAMPSLDDVASSEPSAERPEGWESLEDESAASRLYYQFVDEQRRVRFVERIEDVPEKWRDSVGFVKMSVAPPLSPGDAARARAKQVGDRPRATAAATVAAASGPQVVLYSAAWCGACKKAKRHLLRRGVDFEERNVDQPHIAQELQRKTGRKSIPVLDVDGRVVTGFNPSSYDAILGS